MHTISGSNLNVVVYETVPHLLAAAWYPVVRQEIYINHPPFLVSRNWQGKMRCIVTAMCGEHVALAPVAFSLGNKLGNLCLLYK